MPEQLPKEIFNLISDRSGQIRWVVAYIKVIQFCVGTIPAHILDDLIESVSSFNNGIRSLEFELDQKGYSFDQLEQLTAIVDAAEKDKSRVGGERTP